MPKGYRIGEDFWTALLKEPFVSNRPALESLVQAAQQTGYQEPLQALSSFYSVQCTTIQKELTSSPLGQEGKWLTLTEIATLDLGHPDRVTLRVLLDQNKFPSKKRSRSVEIETEYWLDYDNIKVLDKKGALTAKVKTLEEARSQQEKLGKILSSSPQPQQVPIPHVENNQELGKWVSYKEIIEAGSKYGKHALAYHIRKTENRSLIHAKGATGNKKVYVTASNMHILGLDSLPEAWLGSPGPNPNPIQNDPQNKRDLQFFDIQLGDKPLHFERNGVYSVAHITSLLKNVHSTFFTDEVVSRFVQSSSEMGHIPGGKLVDLLASVDGMVLLDSHGGQKKLEDALQVPFSSILTFLAERGNGYIHELPQIAPGKKYVLRKEIPKINDAMTRVV